MIERNNNNIKMGMCNCNVKTQVIIHADYSVPFSQEDKVKFTNQNSPKTNKSLLDCSNTFSIKKSRNNKKCSFLHLYPYTKCDCDHCKY